MEPNAEKRRWARLSPEILLECRTRLEGSGIEARLRDLSPGGIGLSIPPGASLAPTDHLRVRIRFRGQPEVVREGRVALQDAATGNLGLEWIHEPSKWNGTERRGRARVHLPQDQLFGRLQVRHAHRVWSRVRVVDISSDLGFQLETMGGPGYLLPGHIAPFQLDLPLLSSRRWESQVVWSRPGPGQATLFGLRVIDSDADLVEALGEWVELDRLRPPLALKDLGFRVAALPGQFRFRKVEETGERHEVDFFLGLEPATAGIRLGAWDGPLLVAGSHITPDGADCRLDAIRLRREWTVPDVFAGLWEQTIRHFLSSGSERLLVTCPPGRERLLAQCGLRPCARGGPTWALRRRSVLSGGGIPLAAWILLYSEVGAFALQQGLARIRWADHASRAGRLAAWTLLRDWLEPRATSRLHREVDLWADQAS